MKRRMLMLLFDLLYARPQPPDSILNIWIGNSEKLLPGTTRFVLLASCKSKLFSMKAAIRNWIVGMFPVYLFHPAQPRRWIPNAGSQNLGGLAQHTQECRLVDLFLRQPQLQKAALGEGLLRPPDPQPPLCKHSIDSAIVLGTRHGGEPLAQAQCVHPLWKIEIHTSLRAKSGFLIGGHGILPEEPSACSSRQHRAPNDLVAVTAVEAGPVEA